MNPKFAEISLWYNVLHDIPWIMWLLICICFYCSGREFDNHESQTLKLPFLSDTFFNFCMLPTLTISSVFFFHPQLMLLKYFFIFLLSFLLYGLFCPLHHSKNNSLSLLWVFMENLKVFIRSPLSLLTAMLGKFMTSCLSL